MEYRLPTEAQWEYACRAGTSTEWCFGDDHRQLPQYANFIASTYPVGSLKPNAWGLFDMHGNASEWCQDWYSPSTYKSRQVVSDPTGPAVDERRVLRGGSMLPAPWNVRSAHRQGHLPDYPTPCIGFRVARTIP